MDNSSLNRIIDLIKKTGDRCIVVDPNNDSSYVIISLDDYEKLIFRKSEVKNLTEDELLDKINRDIAIWKASQGEQKLADFSEFSKQEKIEETKEKKEVEPEKEDEKYYFEPIG